MANAFLSETQTGIGTTNTNIYTCPASTEVTIIGLSVSNILDSEVKVNVQLDASGRTSGAEDSVYLVYQAPIPAGGALIVVGGDQKVVMEPGDIVKVQTTDDSQSAVDVVLSHLDIT